MQLENPHMGEGIFISVQRPSNVAIYGGQLMVPVGCRPTDAVGYEEFEE